MSYFVRFYVQAANFKVDGMALSKPAGNTDFPIGQAHIMKGTTLGLSAAVKFSTAETDFTEKYPTAWEAYEAAHAILTGSLNQNTLYNLFEAAGQLDTELMQSIRVSARVVGLDNQLSPEVITSNFFSIGENKWALTHGLGFASGDYSNPGRAASYLAEEFFSFVETVADFSEGPQRLSLSPTRQAIHHEPMFPSPFVNNAGMVGGTRPMGGVLFSQNVDYASGRLQMDTALILTNPSYYINVVVSKAGAIMTVSDQDTKLNATFSRLDGELSELNPQYADLLTKAMRVVMFKLLTGESEFTPVAFIPMEIETGLSTGPGYLGGPGRNMY